MADGFSNSSSSGSDATSHAMDEEGVRNLFIKEMAANRNDGSYSFVREHLDLLVSLGSLDFRKVLESMLHRQRCPEIAFYLRRALSFHAKDAAEAVAYPPARADDMRQAHPELYVLPRRQHALDLFLICRQYQARHYYQEHIRDRIVNVRRNAHVDSLVSSLREILDGEKKFEEEDHDREIRLTYRAIRDYLQLYFPRLCSCDETMIEVSRKKLGHAWKFGEVCQIDLLGQYPTSIRCLVCHARLPETTTDASSLVEHLYMACPAVTPHLRNLLPRPNNPCQWTRRKQLLQQDQADAAAAANAAEAPPPGPADGGHASTDT